MTEKVLKGCKKYVVERVISPSVYWMNEYERGKCYEKELARFEHLLARNVEEYTDTKKIQIGEMVAVGDKTGFHRGLVTDIFNRSSKTIFWISLVDYGNVIETNENNIYLIKDKEFMHKKLNAFEVTIQGIQPAVVEVNYGKNISGGIFQKRVSDNWSPSALQFVKDLIEKNLYVFVRPVCTEKRTISGEIYITQEPGGVPISLSENLCAKGFAVRCDTSQKLMFPDYLQGVIGIEGKIPSAALLSQTQTGKIGGKMGNMNDSSDLNTFPVQQLVNKFAPQKTQNKSCTSSSVTSISENENLKSNTTCDISSNSYSLSWMLKKCQNTTCSPSSYDAIDKRGMCKSEERSSGSHKSFNVNIFRVVQRSIELYNKQKENESPHCN